MSDWRDIYIEDETSPTPSEAGDVFRDNLTEPQYPDWWTNQSPSPDSFVTASTSPIPEPRPLTPSPASIPSTRPSSPSTASTRTAAEEEEEEDRFLGQLFIDFLWLTYRQRQEVFDDLLRRFRIHFTEDHLTIRVTPRLRLIPLEDTLPADGRSHYAERVDAQTQTDEYELSERELRRLEETWNEITADEEEPAEPQPDVDEEEALSAWFNGAL